MADAELGSDRKLPPLVPLWLRTAPLVFLLLWSGGYTAVRIGVDDIEPITFLALRYVVVLAILAPVWLLLRPPLPATRAQWMHLAIVGALIQGFYFGATNIAIKLGVSAVGLAIVLALHPISVALLAPRFVGEPVGRRIWAGLLLGLAGALGATASGIAAAAIALVFITAGTLWEKRFGSNQHPVVASAVQCTVALAIAVPPALMLESGRIAWTASLIASTLYLSLFNSIVAMSLLFAMIRRGAAARATALLFLVPPTSALIAALMLGEPMPPATWLGMALAAAGVMITRRA